ncbi:RnfH family protein [Candidatus Erwinia haradaeae]|uniref:UPF0125 protein ERCISPPS3390_565 n=1 Tax=Candidatus Erwinia haradaeae TaxID=1922217 RepID=A0A451D4U3_9GAMM|nr:RnfH family protein [Candidatus Erwinia haradaeae]VFP80681.1 UPF0125 protein RatB [Candidatus Erwinia haradaeae]
MSNILVDIVYALPNKQYLYRVELISDSNVQQAIIASGILDLRPEINLQKNKVGIFNQFVTLNDKLHNGDRVEIYRPIIALKRSSSVSLNNKTNID